MSIRFDWLLGYSVFPQWFYHQPLPSSRGNHKAHPSVDLYTYQISALYSMCSWSSKQSRTVTSITLLTIPCQLAASQSRKMCSLHLIKLCIHRSMPQSARNHIPAGLLVGLISRHRGVNKIVCEGMLCLENSWQPAPGTVTVHPHHQPVSSSRYEDLNDQT